MRRFTQTQFTNFLKHTAVVLMLYPLKDWRRTAQPTTRRRRLGLLPWCWNTTIFLGRLAELTSKVTGQDSCLSLRDIDGQKLKMLLCSIHLYVVSHDKVKYTFSRGKILLPCAFSLPQSFYPNYVTMWFKGNQGKNMGPSKSATMSMIGCNSTGSWQYNYGREDGSSGALPRLYSGSSFLSQTNHLVTLGRTAECALLAHYSKHEPGKYQTLLRVKDLIPKELRIGTTLFTGVALVCSPNEKEHKKFNHPHVDGKDMTSIFITLGHNISGGRTQYYSEQKSCFPLQEECNWPDPVHEVPFQHGQYQVGPFDKVTHGGQRWKGLHVVISFIVNRDVYNHFNNGGKAIYNSLKN